MYNREKIMKVLHDIADEANEIKPYVLIAQPRRVEDETPAQSFEGYHGIHIDVLGISRAFCDISGEKVDVARNFLIEKAIESGAKYLLFVGEDTVLPYDAFKILHKTAEENPNSVVTGVYYLKMSSAMVNVKVNDWIIVPNVDPGQIIDAYQTGMDCMLIPIDILKRMKEEEPELPYCCVAHGIEDLPFIGEDNFFVHRLRKMGVKLLVNTDVQCLHMDLATGKYTAHPDVNLKNYYTNIKPTERLTLEDKHFLDFRWHSRLPGEINNPKNVQGYGWLPGQDIPKLLEGVKAPVGVEIGTAEGYTTEYLLKTIQDLTLFGIDPYKKYLDWDGNVPAWDRNEKELLRKVEPYQNRYTHIRKTSDEAVSTFDDESLDFVFIDGLHTYEQVLKDCENYYPKLKKGGLFVGHDFSRIQGVNKAVREFAEKSGKEILNAQQDLWYWIK